MEWTISGRPWAIKLFYVIEDELFIIYHYSKPKFNQFDSLIRRKHSETKKLPQYFTFNFFKFNLFKHIKLKRYHFSYTGILFLLNLLYTFIFIIFSPSTSQLGFLNDAFVDPPTVFMVFLNLLSDRFVERNLICFYRSPSE